MARAMKWYTTLVNENAISSGGFLRLPLLSGMSIANMKGSTVTRMIIDIWLRPDTLSSFKILDFGILWYPQAAVDANAFPDLAIEDEKYDWLLRSRMYATGSVSGQNPIITEKHYDNGSQRICRATNDILMMLIDLNSVTAGGVFFSMSHRGLVRLP